MMLVVINHLLAASLLPLMPSLGVSSLDLAACGNAGGLFNVPPLIRRRFVTLPAVRANGLPTRPGIVQKHG